MIVNVHEAKTGLSKLLARVEAGEEVIIARAGKPVARLVAVAPKPQRRPGTHKDLFEIDDSFFDTLPEEELRPWEGAGTISGLLLDTPTFLWWLLGAPQLSETAHAAIAGNGEVAVSAASAWEIATKTRLGKLPGAEIIASRLTSVLAEQGFEGIPVTMEEDQRAGFLPPHHRDPFDRMLIAQSLSRDLTLVSNERLFDAYGVRRLW